MKVEEIHLALKKNQDNHKIQLAVLQDLMSVNDDLEQDVINIGTAEKKIEELKSIARANKQLAEKVLSNFKAQSDEVGYDYSKNLFYSGTVKILENKYIKSI